MRVAIVTTDSREHYKDYCNPQPYFGAAPEALLQGFADMPEVEVHVVSCLQEPVSGVEKLASNIYYHALHVPKRGWLRTGYQGCVRAVRKLLRSIGPDIIHGQGTERECGICAIYSGFTNVLTIHGNMRRLCVTEGARPFSYLWVAARLETLALRRTFGAFCNSRHTHELVKPICRRTWIVPNAVRNQFFRQHSNGCPVSPPVLLNVGTVVPNKRQIEIFEMAHGLWAKGYHFQLNFAGQIDRESEYGRRFLHKVNATQNAKYLGLLSAGELIKQFDRASALIHAPREEAFGLVVAEGLARNLKFFGSRIGGIPEISADAPQAELFELNDWTGLQRAIERWLTMGCPRPANARELMQARYDPHVIARRHCDIYGEVLSNRK